jgi:hypothetical protein
MFLWIQRVGADRMHRFSVAVHDKCPPGLKKRSKLIIIGGTCDSLFVFWEICAKRSRRQRSLW